MNQLNRKTLLAGVAASVLGLGAALAVVLDAIGIAVVCAVALLELVVLLDLLGRSKQAELVRAVSGSRRELKRQSEHIERLDRLIVNVGERAVTESRATEQTLGGTIGDAMNEALSRIDKRGEEGVQDVEALMQLFSRFSPRAAMPSSGRWALEPTMLLHIVELIRTRPIRTIVELGSGTSTVWLAYAMQQRGTGGRMISLDHEPRFAAMTRADLAAHGFTDGVEVRDAPLVDGVLEDHPTSWYDPQSFADVTDIDLLVVDGPPGATGELARYPALPMLLGRLSPGAIVVVDDAGRADEQLMLDRWTSMVPTLQPLSDGGPGRQVFLVLDEPPTA